MVIVRKYRGEVRSMEFHNVECCIGFLSCFQMGSQRMPEEAVYSASKQGEI